MIKIGKIAPGFNRINFYNNFFANWLQWAPQDLYYETFQYNNDSPGVSNL
jgi:hypothetical protein